MSLPTFSIAFTPAPSVKVAINLGAMLDIITGDFVEGRRGEWICNGGLSYLTGIVGKGNVFKSTLMHFMSFTALARCPGTGGNSYDTEVNMKEGRLTKLAMAISELGGENPFLNGRWSISDKTTYIGNEWYEVYRDGLREKRKDASKLMIDTPFWNRDRSGPFQMLIPSFGQLDSFTEFETADAAEMQNKNELGESGANTLHMRQGLAKMRLLMEAPGLCGGSYHYMIMTAHIGKETAMQNAGPAGQVPVKKLTHLKNGDTIKGTTDKFTFVTHNCWHCYDAKPLISKDGDGPLFPRSKNDKLKYDTDLVEVKVRQLRGKNGPSGGSLSILISQESGVQPELSEFYHIKEYGNYGFEGNNTTYSLNIYPDVKLSRTTIRSKIDEDPLLRRSLTLTSELCQMSYLWHEMDEGLICTPKELYDDLKAMGYDWSILLNTRGWWSYYEVGLLPFLSIMDLLKMRVGEYIPFWFTDEQRKSIDMSKAKQLENFIVKLAA